MICDIAYVAQAEGPPGGMVKIGRSANPANRIAQIAQNAPFTLRPICFIDQGAKTERALKERLAAWRVKGEWFAPSEALVSALEEYSSAGRLIAKVPVDEAYVAAEIEPKVRAFIASKSGALRRNGAGDLVYRILHGDPLCFVGREAALVAAVGSESVDIHVAHGWRGASGFADVSLPTPLVSIPIAERAAA